MADLAQAALAASAADRRELSVTRLIRAPRALVWTAWTDPAHIVRWWGPAGCQSTDCSVDLRVGGAFRLTMHTADGTAHASAGIFREIVRPERLVLEGNADDRSSCGAGLPPGARVTVTFEDIANQTKLTIVTRFPTEAALAAARDAGYTIGWPECLDRLAHHVGEIKD